jgi:hypothetical protein
LPGVKLIGVRVTLIRGPVGLRGWPAVGAADTGGAGSAGPAVTSSSVDGSGVDDGEVLSEPDEGDVREGGELVGVGDTAAEVLLSSRDVAGISPDCLPVTSNAVATTRTAAAKPMSTRSSRGLRYHGEVGRSGGCAAQPG